MQKLLDLAEAADLPGKINAMFEGQHINSTEDRAVLHVATRARREQKIMCDGKDVVPDVWEVLDKVRVLPRDETCRADRDTLGNLLQLRLLYMCGPGSFERPGLV